MTQISLEPEPQLSSPLLRGNCARWKSPLRIMHVVDRLASGGMERALIRLIRELDPEVFEHSICTLRGADAEFLPASGINVVQAGRANVDFQFNVPRLSRIIRSFRPTIVHSRNWGGLEAVFAARLAGVPVVVHSEHGYDLGALRRLPIRQRLLRTIAYQMADCVFTVSDELKSFHAAQAIVRANTIQVFPNGVDTVRFCPDEGKRVALRRELNISADALVVGSVGRMVAIKNYPALLQAVEYLVPAIPNLRLMLVGSGPDLDRLKAQASQSSELSTRVLFVGPSERVADLLSAMDVFVLPSLGEGMSNTLLEALAVGLPIVATAVGGNPEVIADGVEGYLFAPGDVQGLSRRLQAVLSDAALRARLGQAARQRAREHFSIDRMLRRYTDLYTDLVTRYRRSQGHHVRD